MEYAEKVTEEAERIQSATSTATQAVRKLLSDTIFFQRIGKLQNTRWKAAE
jgi:hypothetical protein